MELYLQFGHGMMEHSRHLIGAWGGGTVVLSPRDLEADQLRRLASDITAVPGGRVLLDPQFYLPHSDHERLCAHEYWPQDFQSGAFFQGPGLTTLITKLQAINRELATSAFILPGLLAQEVTADWLAVHATVLDEAGRVERDKPIIVTIALTDAAGRDENQIAKLIEGTAQWNPWGYYVVCEHPEGKYLADEPNWLVNMLDLAAGLKLRGAHVILGYCNHQTLIAATTKADALCSGTWMNVRSFPPDKFRANYDEEVRQRATWYYCPQALSEFRIPVLDLARRAGVLASMAPITSLDGGYSASLFAGPQPSSVGFNEPPAFRHYLHAIRGQAQSSSKPTFDETVDAYRRSLDLAETLLNQLNAAGIRGGVRDFGVVVDVNRGALDFLANTRGPILRRKWPTL